MNGIFSYLKSYVILFLVLTILLEMVPKAGMQKYIRFFFADDPCLCTALSGFGMDGRE